MLLTPTTQPPNHFTNCCCWSNRCSRYECVCVYLYFSVAFPHIALNYTSTYQITSCHVELISPVFKLINNTWTWTLKKNTETFQLSQASPHKSIFQPFTHLLTRYHLQTFSILNIISPPPPRFFKIKSPPSVPPNPSACVQRGVWPWPPRPPDSPPDRRQPPWAAPCGRCGVPRNARSA